MLQATNFEFTVKHAYKQASRLLAKLSFPEDQFAGLQAKVDALLDAWYETVIPVCFSPLKVALAALYSVLEEQRVPAEYFNYLHRIQKFYEIRTKDFDPHVYQVFNVESGKLDRKADEAVEGAKKTEGERTPEGAAKHPLPVSMPHERDFRRSSSPPRKERRRRSTEDPREGARNSYRPHPHPYPPYPEDHHDNDRHPPPPSRFSTGGRR